MRKICPADSIQIVDNKPKWVNTCEQCMRCVNYCPKQAVFQKAEGRIKGKNTFYEPTFKPLKLKKHSSFVPENIFGLNSHIGVK